MTNIKLLIKLFKYLLCTISMTARMHNLISKLGKKTFCAIFTLLAHSASHFLWKWFVNWCVFEMIHASFSFSLNEKFSHFLSSSISI